MNNNKDDVKRELPSKSLKIRSLISGMLINILIGSYYVYGNFNDYEAYYLKKFNDSITPTTTLFIQPLWLISQGTGVLFSVLLSEKIGYRLVNNISFFVYCLNTFALIWIQELWLFFVIYGVITGLSIGFGYLPSLYIAWTYYPDHKSVVTGCLLFFAGLSPLITAPIGTMVVNPND